MAKRATLSTNLVTGGAGFLGRHVVDELRAVGVEDIVVPRSTIRDLTRQEVVVGYDGAAPVNLGTGVETTISELASMIARLTGFAGEIIWDSSKPDGQPRRALNTDRARSEFGFSAQIELEDGLRETVEWWINQGEPQINR